MSRHPAERLRVEASILARLLGLKLLKLDATVVVVPSGATEPLTPPSGLVPSSASSVHRSPLASTSRDAGGRRSLAHALQSIHEGAELLEEARRNGI